MEMYHDPVMLNESLNGLNIKPDGRYVDATFGGGGHSKAILSRLNTEGRLYAFDQDPDAQANSIDDERFLLIPQNFSYLRNYLKLYKAIPVDGILADLGVSSHQFDTGERGFSFRFTGPLDMRMDKKRELTAKKVLNEYEEKDLRMIFNEYGEIKNSYRLAKHIVTNRNQENTKSIEAFLELINPIAPTHAEHKFFAQVFQAIRIEVNDELKVLKDLLTQAKEVLSPNGRMVLITYHSLEDRLVKNYFRSGNFEGKPVKDFYGNLERPLEPVNRKPIVPSDEEIKRNNRARSAKLRIAENG